MGQLPPDRKGGRKGRIVVKLRRLEDLHDRTFDGRTSQQVSGVGDVVSAEDGIHPGRPGLDQVLILLGQAATHRDPEVRLARLDRFQVAEVAVQLVIGVLPDTARVQDDDVRVIESLRRDQAVGFQEAGQPLGVVLVHLAPERADQIAARLPRLHDGQDT